MSLSVARADEAMLEGRSRVQDLRAADRSSDLTDLLKERAVEAEFDPSIPIRIVTVRQRIPAGGSDPSRAT